MSFFCRFAGEIMQNIILSHVVFLSFHLVIHNVCFSIHNVISARNICNILKQPVHPINFILY